MIKYRIIPLLAIALILLLAALTSFAQTYPCPLKNGRFEALSKARFSHDDPSNGATILSEHDTVQSVIAGEVILVKKYGDMYMVGVQIESQLVVCYKYLKDVFVNPCDSIGANEKIGVLHSPDNNYYFTFALYRKTGREDPRPYLNCD